MNLNPPGRGSKNRNYQEEKIINQSPKDRGSKNRNYQKRKE